MSLFPSRLLCLEHPDQFLTLQQHRATKIRHSRRLLPVGPVTIASPRALKKLNESLFCKLRSSQTPFSPPRRSASGSVIAPAAGLLPSIPSVPALNTTTSVSPR